MKFPTLDKFRGKILVLTDYEDFDIIIYREYFKPRNNLYDQTRS